MKHILKISSLILLILLLAAAPCSGSQLQESATASKDGTDIKTAHVGDIDMAYKILGNDSGEPLVMIMGFKAGMDMWDPRFLSDLSSHNRVIIFDNRGMGYTTGLEENFSIVELSNDTLGLMDALNIDKASILGYSMGAFMAQEMAIRHPERVDKLILYAGDCTGPSPKVLDAFINNSGPGSRKEKAMKKIGLLVPPMWLSQDQALCDWFFVPKENLSGKTVERQLWAMESWPGTCDRLGRILAPTLVVRGTEDVIMPLEGSFNLIRGINGSWLAQFNGGGHGLMYQYPDRLAKVVDDFIELS